MIPLRIVSFFKFTPIQVYMTRYKRQILQRPSSLSNLVPSAFPLKNGWAVLSPATNVPKILDLKSSSENWRWAPV